MRMLLRREIAGWEETGFDASAWRAVETEPHDEAIAFQPYPCEQVTAVDSVQPLAMTEPTPGAFVFDLGQNFAGVASLRVRK